MAVIFSLFPVKEKEMEVVAVGAVVALLSLLYKAVVPADSAELGSLEEVDAKRQQGDPPLSYPKDFFGMSEFAHSTQGKTHYFLLGPEKGEKVVLVHGITTGWSAMPAFVNGLASKGFRVLAYDLYGRGYSSAPPAVYNEDLYVNQLKGLLDSVGWETANIVGFSLGGGIATAFAARQAKRVDRLVLVAPAGLRKSLPILGKMLGIPFIGKFLAHSFGRPILNYLSKSNHNPVTLSLPHMKHYLSVTSLVVEKHSGFMRAYVSTVMNGPVMKMESRYEKVGKELGERTLCIWGTSDRVVSFEKDSPIFKQLVPQARMVEIQGVGHSIIAEKNDEVVAHVTNFLKTSS